jgi:hypothetical protein
VKPTVMIRCVANVYAGPDERIVEFGNGAHHHGAHRGGLIALRNLADGGLRVEVYRVDPGVDVVAPVKPPDPGDLPFGWENQ